MEQVEVQNRSARKGENDQQNIRDLEYGKLSHTFALSRFPRLKSRMLPSLSSSEGGEDLALMGVRLAARDEVVEEGFELPPIFTPAYDRKQRESQRGSDEAVERSGRTGTELTPRRSPT